MIRPADPNRIFGIESDEDFNNLALEIFRYQAEANIPYREFIFHLGVDPGRIDSVMDIPFMPVDFFRTRRVVSGNDDEEIVFSSSGTTGEAVSRHYVTDLSLYRKSFRRGFEHFYGNTEDTVIIALLPSYLEREGSSLVFMANDLIEASNSGLSGFYLGNEKELIVNIKKALGTGRKVILLGVTFALLDLAERNPMDLSGTIIMETGGMKGRRKEITREEVHAKLTGAFNCAAIHSEYGMTELLSQAYSNGDGIFRSVPWMKVFIRDPYNPLNHYTPESEQSGGVDIADLANINSCSFVSTGDIGKIYKDGSFSVQGRFDNAAIRGCNLLVL